MTSNIIKDRGDYFRDVTEKTEDRQNVHLLDWEKVYWKIIEDYEEFAECHIDTALCGELEDFIKKVRQQAVNETIENVEEMIENCSLDLAVGSSLAPFRKDYTDKYKLRHQLSQLKVKNNDVG